MRSVSFCEAFANALPDLTGPRTRASESCRRIDRLVLTGLSLIELAGVETDARSFSRIHRRDHHLRDAVVRDDGVMNLVRARVGSAPAMPPTLAARDLGAALIGL